MATNCTFLKARCCAWLCWKCR